MMCPRCNSETKGYREGDSNYCTVCGGTLGPSYTPTFENIHPKQEEDREKMTSKPTDV